MTMLLCEVVSSYPFSLFSLGGKKQRNKILAKLCDGMPNLSPAQNGSIHGLWDPSMGS